MTIQPRLIHPQVIHLEGCTCGDCDWPAARRGWSPLETAFWTLGGFPTGAAIAFLIDPHGAWHVTTSAVAQLLGVG